MNKKCLLVYMLIFTMVGTMFLPTISAADQSFRIFKFETETDLELGDISLFDDPIAPGTNVEVELSLKFRFEKPPLFPAFLLETRIGNWIMFRDFQQNMSTEIELKVESPDFCNVELENSKILIENFSTSFNNPVKTKLNITVSEDATALQTGKIIVMANFTPAEKWGLNESGDVAEISVTTAYESAFEVQIENSTLEITPTKPTFVPLNITNNGNGDTTVFIEFMDVPKNWTVKSDVGQVELSPGETKTITLNVTSIRNFDNETIKFEFSSILTSDETVSGATVNLQIRFENDGSLKDEDKFEIDVTLLIVILVVILVALILIVFLARRKKKE